MIAKILEENKTCQCFMMHGLNLIRKSRGGRVRENVASGDIAATCGAAPRQKSRIVSPSIHSKYIVQIPLTLPLSPTTMFSALKQASRARSTLSAYWSTKPSTALRSANPFRTLVTKRFTEDHEVVSFDDATGLGTVCLTDHAQSSLGDVVFVELPTVGSEVVQGDAMGAVESVKAASDIYAPVSGSVETVNEVLNDRPNLLNKSPEDEGWLCKIRLTDPTEIEKLMTEEAYKASLDS
ncbi:hypothetical protein PLICRDRAFT_397319 [Plicaturopsis crispa FD-325 SS-3]|nr:hypothetical protein PLICRDRAFT_397319 [Plicaturopsis crispa FD-325 SS-3]